MSAHVTFDSTRFRSAIARVVERRQSIAGKRIPFVCPACAARNRITVEQVARQATVTCVACGGSIEASDKKGGFGSILKGK